MNDSIASPRNGSTATILVVLNGNPTATSGGTLAEVLREQGVDAGQRGIAVALNDEVVPRSQWNEREIADGDRVEVITAMQGG